MTHQHHIDAIRAASARARDAEAAKQAAVTSARVAGVAWAEIGEALGVTRQSARERYIAIEQIAKAWKAVEGYLAEIGRGRDYPRSSADMVGVLRDEGSLDDADVLDLQQLLHRYSQGMLGETITVREAELLTDKAIPLSAKLFGLTATPHPA
ncbi:hypothetical protein [Nocardioides sp.]|jgi:hypothetical protein|uniref:hypothetical protein n=1 Tax=Nocardioides sp. TaxID=35761 RepID=UPI001DB90BAE|nr:hypothetical protein [Nocardioides sp.]MBU1801052.1 hypothetical protein [Actinomycetota bacterium]